MKTGRKVWSILLVLAMVLGMLVPAVYAETGDGQPEEVTITGFEVEPVVLTEGVDTSEIVYADGSTCKVYSVLGKNPMVILYFSDGSSYAGTKYEVEENYGIIISTGDLEATKGWTVGQYTHRVSIVDTELAFDLNVTIVEDPIKSITAAPVTFIDGMYSFTNVTEDGKEINVYSVADKEPEITVNYKDGTSQTYQWYEVYDTVGPIVWVDSDNITADWGVGEHTFRYEIAGKTVTVPVQVIENPVASVTAAPVTAYEGIHQYTREWWDDETQTMVKETLYELWNLKTMLTVNYTDGTSETASLWELSESGMDIVFPVGDDVTTTWTVGNTYDFPIVVSGRECTLKVQIKENPVASVKAQPVEVKDSDRIWLSTWNDKAQLWEEFKGFDLTSYILFEVTMADGTVYTVNPSEIWENDMGAVVHDTQTAENPWLPGETYTVEFETLGHSGEVEFKIIDDGVKSVKAEAQYDLYETLSGNTGNLEAANPAVTVELNDGTVITFPYERAWEYLENRELRMYLVNEPEDSQLAVGEHQAVVEVDGVCGEFTVTVLENPVKSFTVVPKYPFAKNVHGILSSYTDESGNEVPYFQYHYSAMLYSVVLELKDGTTETYANLEDIYIKYRSYNYGPEMYYEPGTIEEAGTYTVKAALMNMECEQTLTIVDAQIKSVTGTYNGTLVENISGMLNYGETASGEWVEYFHYYPDWEKLQFTITYADGTQETIGLYDFYMGGFVRDLFTSEDGQSPEAPWKLGKNKMTGYLLGFEFEIEIEIVENNIEKLEVKATKPLYQGWNAYVEGNSSYLEVLDADPEIAITYTDGTTKTYTFYQLIQEYPNTGISSVNGSTAGKKTACLWFANETYEFEVEVKANPVKSVTVAPSKKLTEGQNGGFYQEMDTVPVYTVTFTDGTVTKLYGDEQVYEKYGFYPRWNSPCEPDEFVVGKNTSKVELFGYTMDFTFEIVKAANPLERITAKAVAPLYENTEPYHDGYGYAALVELTLHYADGTTKTVMANKLLDAYGRSAVTFEDDQFTVQWGVGIHKATAVYEGLKAEFTVEVVANPYVKVSITKDNGLTVLLEKADGSKETMTAMGFQTEGIEAKGCVGNLTTDKGILNVIFYFSDENKANIAAMDYQGLVSNSLEGCKWLSQMLVVETVGDVPAVSVGQDSQELTELVDENAYHVWLTVSEVSENSLPEEDAALIEEAIEKLEDHEAAIVLDLSVYKDTVYGTKKVSEIPEKLEITIGIPQSILASGELLSEFKIIRVHNGTVEVLDTIYNKESNTITFYTDKFSTYSLSYSTHKLTKVDAKAATCTEDGNTQYYTCSHCDKLFADDKAATETTAEAVKVKAGHKLEKVAAKEATTAAEGNKEHYKCSVCGKLFADAEGKTETTLADVTIPKVSGGSGEGTGSGSGSNTGSGEGTGSGSGSTGGNTGSGSGSGNGSAQTGDETPIVLLMVLMVVSALLAGKMSFNRKRSF